MVVEVEKVEAKSSTIAESNHSRATHNVTCPIKEKEYIEVAKPSASSVIRNNAISVKRKANKTTNRLK